MGYRKSLLAFASLCALFSFPACDSQVGPTYQGEPQAVIHGTLSDSFPDPNAGPTEVAVSWMNLGVIMARAFSQLAHQSVPADFANRPYVQPVHASIQLTDLTKFEVRLFNPPPQSMMFKFDLRGPDDGPRASMGVVEIIKGGASAIDRHSIVGEQIGGYILYLDRDVFPQDGGLPWIQIKAPLHAGFHIVRINYVWLNPDQIPNCVSGLLDAGSFCDAGSLQNVCAKTEEPFGDEEVDDLSAPIELRVDDPHFDPCQPEPDNMPQSDMGDASFPITPE